MSELEIKRRQEYKRNRKRWTVIQLVAIVLLLVTSLGSFLIYTKIDQNQYIEYAEKSDIDYKVQYTENEFFDEEWIGKGQAYISALIGDISADFSYKMDVAADMSLDYTYWIDAKLVVSSTKEGKTYYSQEESLLPKQNEFKKTASAVKVEETLSIDYVKFNKVAKSFVKTHNLKDASSFLLVTLYVDTTVSHNGYENKCNSSYSTTLNIPLAEDTFSIYSTSSKAAGKVDSFEFKGSVNKAIFLNIGISSSALVVILAVILFVFLHLTRNEDITYAAKVRKILNSYSSFIQRIEGEFNFDGYQVVNVKTFTEMLGIRDTIQSPVLMLENRDETMTQFFIPTNTKILYVFEIKVDNYDEIYSRIEAEKLVEPTLEFCVDDTDAPEEAVVMAAVAEPEEPTVELESENTEDKPLESTVTVEEIMSHLVEEVDEGEDGGVSLSYIDESGEKIKIACKRSFTANLIQSNPQVKKYYNEIKNLILSYKGVKDRSNWRIESFNKGRVNLFKLKIRGKTICLYCALNPDDFDKAKYFHEKTDAKMFEGVPMMVRIKSDRGLKRAKELVELVMANFEIAINPKASIIDYAGAFPYDTTKSLVERGLIKILIPGAVAAEPKPHHHVHKDISENPIEPAETELEVTAEEPVAVSEEPLKTEEPAESGVTVEEIMSHLVEEVDDGEDGGVSLSYIDESGEKIKIACKRSFTANLIQSNPQVKKYYNEIKNLILSYKGVKDRSNWRIESFNKGRVNLFKLKIRGKTICLYCALNPDDFDKAKYFHEKTDAKMFEGVPMMVRIKSDRGLKRAKELVELVMSNFTISKLKEITEIDFAGAYPYDTTKRLVERGLIKILIPGAVAAEPKPHHHAHKEISEKPKITTESK